jgi:hypothetical protein
MSAAIDAWLAAACADARRRGLDELAPLLEGLARSTASLRAADAELDVRERPATPDRDAAPGRAGS